MHTACVMCRQKTSLHWIQMLGPLFKSCHQSSAKTAIRKESTIHINTRYPSLSAPLALSRDQYNPKAWTNFSWIWHWGYRRIPWSCGSGGQSHEGFNKWRAADLHAQSLPQLYAYYSSYSSSCILSCRGTVRVMIFFLCPHILSSGGCFCQWNITIAVRPAAQSISQ